MATEIIEIDAPWAEKWTKTRVSFSSAPTVISTHYLHYPVARRHQPDGHVHGLVVEEVMVEELQDLLAALLRPGPGLHHHTLHGDLHLPGAHALLLLELSHNPPPTNNIRYVTSGGWGLGPGSSSTKWRGNGVMARYQHTTLLGRNLANSKEINMADGYFQLLSFLTFLNL